jgi:hypothetical protein
MKVIKAGRSIAAITDATIWRVKIAVANMALPWNYIV